MTATQEAAFVDRASSAGRSRSDLGTARRGGWRLPEGPAGRIGTLLGFAAVVALAGAAGLATVLSAPQPFTGRPAARNYIPIQSVPPQPLRARARPGAATGLLVSPCGGNEHGHENADNVITSPRSPGAAHHTHEYVGNVSTNAFSTDASLAAGKTTCRNGDLSAYYWPVLRLLPGRGAGPGSHLAHGQPGPDRNIGTRVPPTRVLAEFRGNPRAPVVAMPRFLRLVTGDARAATAAAAAAGHAHWGCSGAGNRTTELYPLCPPGQQVVRTFDFPSCWDGLRIDSANHRSHAVFPGSDGTCPRGTAAIPQLRLQVAYAVPPGPSYAIDAFPEQRRSPTTDHADFINIMPDRLMRRAVACINAGSRC